MTSSRKGLYDICAGCKFKIQEGKYPCSKSHRQVRGRVKYERDFDICLLKERKK